MADRIVVTGCGRSGTKYTSRLLTAAGLPCGHELAYNADHAGVWPEGMRADSSWMAAPRLPVPDPVVLLVRHPLRVVASWVEIGFFSRDMGNVTHGPLLEFAPWVYDYPTAPDRALAMWLVLTETTLAHAEMVLHLESVDAGQLARLLRWADVDPHAAEEAYESTGRVNRHEQSRAATRVTHEPTWRVHDADLTIRARHLTRLLGYDPDEVPHG